MKQHRNIPNDYKLKAVTVSQNASGKYFASILFEYEEEITEKKLESFIGLDFSMHELYVHQFPSFQKVKVLINRKNQR